jgi:hypothetical protein
MGDTWLESGSTGTGRRGCLGVDNNMGHGSLITSIGGLFISANRAFPLRAGDLTLLRYGPVRVEIVLWIIPGLAQTF